MGVKRRSSAQLWAPGPRSRHRGQTSGQPWASHGERGSQSFCRCGLLTQSKPTIWNSTYRLPVLCLVSSHLPLSLSLFFSLQISEAALLATRKSLSLNYSPSSTGIRGCSWDAPLSFSERPFSLCRNNPCPLPWGSLPRPLPLCLLLQAELFPATSLCVSPGLL